MHKPGHTINNLLIHALLKDDANYVIETPASAEATHSSETSIAEPTLALIS